MFNNQLVIISMTAKRKLEKESNITDAKKPKICDHLAKKYSHVYDQSIKFRECDHTYFVNWTGDKKEYCSDGIISVTGFIHINFTDFNTDIVITNMQSSKNWYKSKYYGMSRTEIKNKWQKIKEDASTAGTLMHYQIENMYNGSLPSEPYSKEFSQFLVYADKMKDKFLPFRTEWMLRSPKDYKLTGTIDMLYIPKCPKERSSFVNGRRVLHLRMSDWKRSKKISIYCPFSKTGIGICKDMPDTNFYHYSLQLNTYKYMLENWYKDMVVDGVLYNDIKIDTMFLIVMHPETRTKYAELLVPNLQDRVKLLMEERKLQLTETKISKSTSLQPSLEL